MPKIGRKEIVLFFYMYAVIELLAIFLDSAVIPTASGVYPVRRSSVHHDPIGCSISVSYSFFLAPYMIISTPLRCPLI